MPLRDILQNVLCTGLVFLFMFFCINDRINLGDIFLPSIESGNRVINLFGFLLEVLVHKNVRRLLEIEVEDEENDEKWNELEDYGEREPVKLHEIEKAKNNRY